MIGDQAVMVARTLLICVSLAFVSVPHSAQATDSSYEPALMRLSEILGSLQFLNTLCGDKGDRWRLEMEKLLDAEKPEEERRRKLVANFNRGYRSFEINYTSCTASADEAIKLYMKEGAALTRDVATRFGN